MDVGGCFYDLDSINIGVPQGSVLGPQLFNVYINDITGLHPGKNILFADDAVFYITNAKLITCLDDLTALLNNLKEWLLNNKLTINTDKTKLMLFTPRPVHTLPDINLNGQLLEWVSSIKYLGITLDHNLNFILQSQQVTRHLSKMQGIFYSIKNLMPVKTLLNIY